MRRMHSACIMQMRTTTHQSRASTTTTSATGMLRSSSWTPGATARTSPLRTPQPILCSATSSSQRFTIGSARYDPVPLLFPSCITFHTYLTCASLSQVNNTAVFKFIVTSVPFTSLWTHDALTDSWAGFPVEKASLLRAFHSVPNVILLSGDRHEFAAIEYESGDHGNNVLEVSTSPMSMFYMPFIRTLRPRSEEVVNKTKEEVTVAEDGTKEAWQYLVEIPKEKVIRYIGEGNYKWSVNILRLRDALADAGRSFWQVFARSRHQRLPTPCGET